MENEQTLIAARRRKGRVLTVAMDEYFAAELRIFLESNRYAVRAAETQAEALEVIRSDLKDFLGPKRQSAFPHVVLLNIRSGLDSEIDFIAQAKSICPVIFPIAIVPLSFAEMAVRAMEAGAYDYLFRPVELQDLLTRIDRCFEKIELEKAFSKAEAVRRKSDFRYRALVENVVDGIVTIDARGRILSFNPAAERIFGYKAWEAIGKNVSLLMPEPYRSEHDRYIENYLNTGVAKIIGIGRETVGVRKGGATFPIDLAVSVMWEEDSPCFIGIVRDITESKRSQDAVRQSEERLSALSAFQNAILNDAHNTIIATDLKGTITLFNKTSEKMLGYAAEEMVGKATPEIIHDRREVELRAEELSREYGRTMEPGFGVFVLKASLGEPETREWTYMRKDGSRFPVLLSVSSLRDAAGKDIGYLGVGSDISQRKEIESEIKKAKESAESANQAKSVFLANMSHELRTPMNAILGFSQLLQSDPDHPLTTAQTERLGEILKAGDHLLELINEVLDLSRIESGKLVLSLESVPIHEVLMETMVLIEPLAQKMGVRMDVDFARIADRSVRADRVRLRQILLNLLSNAVKYNKPRGTATLEGKQTSAKSYRLCVIDTGPGIPEDQMGKLFEPFSRLNAESSGVEGTGIGLTISKRLVELMGGSIGLKSAVGKGTEFFIDLSLAEKTGPGKETDKVFSTAKKDEMEPERRATLLYVDDDEANRVLIEHILRRRPDLRLISTPQAMMGIDLARAHRPDLILLDLQLPHMDGFEALELLRTYEETRGIPVVAFSAYAMEADIKKGLEAGFIRYITKPFKVADFLRTIDDVLRLAKDNPARSL
ncbi:MAG: PAS domain S-box protein [Nitrospinae bacterium]|nr:PAS domain S-box protein [Nitrospinota bacterium]